MKNILYLFFAITLFGCTDSDGNPCLYEPTLITSAVTNITETTATLNGVVSIVSQNCEDPNNTEQGFVYSTSIQPTTDDIQVNVNGTDISTTLENLEPNTTYYVRSFLTNVFGDFYGNEVSFIATDEPSDCDVVYLADNGITIKACEDANVGDTGVINGVEYTVVDRDMLDQVIDNNGDITVVCTSKITEMNYLFMCHDDFNHNQPIGNWDVSNVTNMGGMFYGECETNIFNQDISQWDVSSVTNMYGMFFNSVFNQPIGNWNVSSVTNMQNMFDNAISFNQDLSSWNVSSVTNMGYMFASATAFNQDLSSWNVNNVTNYDGFSTNTPNWTLPKPNFQ